MNIGTTRPKIEDASHRYANAILCPCWEMVGSRMFSPVFRVTRAFGSEIGRCLRMGSRTKPRKEMAIDERQQRVSEMYAKGYTQFVIATFIGVDQKTISRDVESIRKQWLEDKIGSYDDNMLKQLIGIDAQESALWEAWYRSCEQEVISTVTHKKQLRERRSDTSDTPKKGRGHKRKNTSQNNLSNPVSEMVVVESNEKTTTRQMIGDPRFMAEITRVRELRCKLLGLLEDAPPTNPVINIWQSLQEMKFDRDRDDIEEAITSVRQLPARPNDDSGLKDSTGYKNIPTNPHLPSGFTDLDDNKTDKNIPGDDTPLDIK